MAPSISVLYILFTVGFLTKWSTVSSQVEFEVNFDNEPEDVVGIKGKPLSLPCKPRTSQQKELLDIKWYHDNKLMDFTNDKRRTVQNGTLYFSKLIHKKGGHTDEGEYRCVVDRENGSLSSKPVYLRISVLPENVSCYPVKQNVEAGSNVRLTCELEFLPELEIEWERDEYKLPQNKLKYATISGPDMRGSILYIFNVVPDDSGNYRCTAKNVLLNKRRHSSSGTLTVFPKQRNDNQRRLSFLSATNYFSSLSSPIVQKDVKEGENVTLDCVTDGYPIPILTWTYSKNNDSKPVEIFNSTSTGYNIVEIRNISRYQAGWYTCSAINLSSGEFKTRLKVLTAPEIRENTGNLVFQSSRTIRLRCLAHGVPVPEIYWLKDGNLFNITSRTTLRTSVNESEQLRYSELVVSSTVTSDAGLYQCMAKNSVGSSWVVNRLVLNASKPAPMPPEKVSCESISSSQVNLSWEVPSNVEKLKAFSIHYHLTDNGKELQKVMRNDYRSFRIGRLLPYKNYTFYLRLYGDSASEFSEKVICQTGEEVPIDAPKTELKTVNPNTIHVTWTPLDKDKARGVVIRYKIQWRLTNALCSKVDQVAGDVLDYTITDLIPGNKYDVRVLAGTSKGWPYPNFPWETIEVPLNNNINIPYAPEVTSQAVNFSSIEVKWNLSYNAAEVIGYKIYFRKENCSLVGPVVVPSNSSHYILRNLDAATWYEIIVMAFTKYHEGESGISSIHTLPKEFSNGTIRNLSFILEPPVSLEADPISSQAINLTWKPHPASLGEGNISYYTVCFNLVETSHINNATICLRSLGSNVTIEGLNPFTLYEFKVRSHGLDDKQSAFSRTVECYSLEDVPSQVPEIIWKAVNKTATNVAWRVPLESNGILRNYTLYYTHDSNLPLHLWNVKVVPASTQSTIITDLSANVKYYVIVRASTSAGYGPYDSPKPFIIPSINEIDRNEFATKSSKDKQNDHYVGIMVGLGIGLCCIMLCTTCILCRRRCLKSEMSQEFEVTSSRHGNGNDCHRDREFVTGSRETEYFTFLSSQREQADLKEISVQHLDNKALHPNSTTNGVRMSLLSEVRTSNGSSEKANICITENPRYDSNYFESPLLDARTQSNSSNRSNDIKFSRDICGESKIPLLVEKQKLSSDTGLPFESTTKHSAVAKLNYRKETLPSYPEQRFFTKNKGNFSLQNSIDVTPDSDRLGSSENCNHERLEEVEEEDEQWTNLSSVLQNPEFRFSDSSSSDKKKNKINGIKVGDKLFKEAVHVFKGNNGNNGNDEFKNREIYDIYKNSKLSLHLKEITQES